MYLARLTDKGHLAVYEIDGIVAEADHKGGIVTTPATPKTWRFTNWSGKGWAAIHHMLSVAIMSVHAAAEQREVA